MNHANHDTKIKNQTFILLLKIAQAKGTKKILLNPIPYVTRNKIRPQIFNWKSIKFGVYTK